MKRSEMVEKVLKRYNEEYCKPFEELGYKIPRLAPSEIGWILKAFQDEGMLPPAYYDEYYDDEPDCDGMIPEWESE